MLATREHERNRSLAGAEAGGYRRGGYQPGTPDSAQAARDAAKAGLARAQSALQPARAHGRRHIVIRAPVAGSVLRVPQKSENVGAGGQSADRDRRPWACRSSGGVPVAGCRAHASGQKATIENWGGPPLAATVERIEPVARLKISALGVEEQRTNVVLQFVDRSAASALGHEFRVDVRVAVEDAGNVLRAPLGALFRRDTGWAVYKVVDGRARAVAVTTGIADTSYRQITGGPGRGRSGGAVPRQRDPGTDSVWYSAGQTDDDPGIAPWVGISPDFWIHIQNHA